MRYERRIASQYGQPGRLKRISTGTPCAPAIRPSAARSSATGSDVCPRGAGTDSSAFVSEQCAASSMTSATNCLRLFMISSPRSGHARIALHAHQLGQVELPRPDGLFIAQIIADQVPDRLALESFAASATGAQPATL